MDTATTSPGQRWSGNDEQAVSYTCTLTVDNIHCSSCVSYIREILQHLSGINQIDISVIEHMIRVQYSGSSDYANRIVAELSASAFQVTYVQIKETASKRSISSYDLRTHELTPTPRLPKWRIFMSVGQKAHLKHCELCQDEYETKKSSMKRIVYDKFGLRQWIETWFGRRMPTVADEERGGEPISWMESKPEFQGSSKSTPSSIDDQNIYETELSIQGMSCASCVSSITTELERIRELETVRINLLEATAVIRYKGPEARYEVFIAAIEDVGFEAELSSVRLVTSTTLPKDRLKVILSIEGMTCGSCTGSVTRALQALSFVSSVEIDLLTDSATVHLEGAKNIDQVVTIINELGYASSVVSVAGDQMTDTAGSINERLVEFTISGMYCPRCPPKFGEILRRSFQNDVVVLQAPSLDRPRLKVAYKPRLPSLSIRELTRILASVDPACQISIHHGQSIEQRSLDIQKRERNRILRHLVLTFLVAIPSFILGIVYMSLVSSNNMTKIWLEEAIWRGSASRIEWALLIMTTPAYLYGGALFHERALKEVWSMWRPRSKVPILRRFYRFGSMNLLISTGTSVAYFSSVAVLIMNAASSTTQEFAHTPKMTARQSTTYFDTVTFLILFILIGKFLEAYSKGKAGDTVSMLRGLRPQHALLITSSAAAHEIHTSERVPVDMLEAEDMVNVLHGACPPADGTIAQKGTFLFDESSLTGESIPVVKAYGDTVFTGSLNISDPVRIKLTDIRAQTMLDKIVSVVREGQAKRAPIERLADMLTGYFTPFITMAAILTWVIWLGLGTGGKLPPSWLDVSQGSWPFWSLEFAIAVFVVACPCGIGLAAPTALFVGGGLAAKNGILVQGGGEAFQEASGLNAIVFDKTGTLTEGKMTVTESQFLNFSYDGHANGNDTVAEGMRYKIALSLAYALEERSTHPMAKAIAEYCRKNVPNTPDFSAEIMELKEIPGKGLRGKFRIHQGAKSSILEALIGNEGFLKAENTKEWVLKAKSIDSTARPSADWTTVSILSRSQSAGCSTAILAIRECRDSSFNRPVYQPAAIFAVSDSVRSDAAPIIAALQKRGIEVHMCTGDNADTARAVATQLGIPVSHVRAGVLPQDKARYIQELQQPHDDDGLPSEIMPKSKCRWTRGQQHKSRRIIAFAGDGTNDSPALTIADVSIAISHPSSSDIALTSASFILLSANLSSILTLVTLSRRVFRRVKFNFFWAGIYNLCLIPVAAGVLFPINADYDPVNGHGGFRLSPVWAAAAMAGSSLSVVLSSLALRLPEANLGLIGSMFAKGKVLITAWR